MTNPKETYPVCLNSTNGRDGFGERGNLQPSLHNRVYDSNGVACAIATSDFFNPMYLVTEEYQQD